MKCSDRTTMTRRQYLATMASDAAAFLCPHICFSESQPIPLRVAISIATLEGANVEDARAAYRVWLAQLSREFGLRVAVPVPEIFIPSEELMDDVRQNTIDCYGITALELAKIAAWTDPNSLVLQDDLADGLEYVLLVHNGRPYRMVRDLRGKHIVTHRAREMVLLPAWLSLLLAVNHLPPPEEFFASNTARDKVDEVVLPVFFGSVDAGCVARRDWEMAVELNPQLNRDLRVLAISPKIIPILFAFRIGTRAQERQVLIQSVLRINSITAGQQIVAMYQSHGFTTRPMSVMAGTLDFVRAYDRLLLQQSGAPHGKP